MEIILFLLAIYYFVGLALCALVYVFIRKEYGGIAEFAKICNYAPAELAEHIVFKITVAFVFVTVLPFVTPVTFTIGLGADWKAAKGAD